MSEATKRRGPAAETAATATPATKLLRRAEAARLLGMSVSTLRRREGDVLHPIVGEDGVHLFDEAHVRSVSVTLRGREALGALERSGDTAAEVFTLLDEGVHPVDIVKRLRHSPDIVTALRGQWARMRGGFVVTADEAAELGRLARSGKLASATAAIAALHGRVTALQQMRQGSATCAMCGDRTASICEPCVIRTRGPLSTTSVTTEERAATDDADSKKHIRVVVDAYWDSFGDCDGHIVTLRSDWVEVGRDESVLPTLLRRPARRHG